MRTDIINRIETKLAESYAFNHPLLENLLVHRLEREAACRFAIQWYKAAKAHKLAFPGLIHNTQDDVIRIQLIEILREEYGYGNPERIHARILEKFLTALGIDMARVEDTRTAPEVEFFAREVDDIWSRGEPTIAFGVHFALEFLAAKMHQSFYKAVSTIEGLNEGDVEYFQIHSTAEVEHATIALKGLRYIADNLSTHDRLCKGVTLGIELVSKLEDGLHVIIQTPPAKNGILPEKAS